MVVGEIHKLLLVVRVSSYDLAKVYAVLEDENAVTKKQITLIPYSDGERDCLVLMFSCSTAVATACHAKLAAMGIGKEVPNSDVNIVPLAFFKHVKPTAAEEEEEQRAAADDVEQGSDMKPAVETLLTKFQSSIKARIAVENILEAVYNGASFSFDFVMLVIIAAVLSVIGLVTDSAVVLVAAMLVSPMMGPILGFTFGTVVGDMSLVKTGLRSEMLCWVICIVIGYIGGLCAAPMTMRQNPWPTREMFSRGEWSSLYVGIAIAIPSGVGVALSIMGQNTNSLVGVAISASLLPPCVNTGIMFAYATLMNYYFNMDCLPTGNQQEWSSCCADVGEQGAPLKDCPDSSFPEFCCALTIYSVSQVVVMAINSFLITVVNIISIWIFAALTFYFKEVAPLPNKSTFWKSLVPQARAFNVAVRRGEISSTRLNEEIHAAGGVTQANRRAMLIKMREQTPKIGEGGLQFSHIGDSEIRGRGDMIASLQAYYEEREAEELFESEQARLLEKRFNNESKFL